MRFFFRSRQFKIILVILISLITVSICFSIIGSKIAPGADIAGTITAPIRSAATAVSNAFSDFADALSDSNETALKNSELETEINELRKKLADYETLNEQNEFYKNYLEIKDSHPDFKFAPATLISRDSSDAYQGFIINQGSTDGVEAFDPVITDAGLVGFVSEVGLTTSKVTTILSSDFTAGALDNRTNDSGIVSGLLKTAKQNQTRFKNLSRSCNIAIGDYVITSGEGIFPKGLLIGTIKYIGNDEYNTSIYADVEPFVDIQNIRNVMVITEFEGQGNVLSESGK